MSKKTRSFRVKLRETVAALVAATTTMGSSGALPILPTVTTETNPGSTTFDFQPTSLTVLSGSTGSVVDWAAFDIANSETVTFKLPDTGSIVVNRVSNGQVPSFINGALTSNGNVWVLNPSGVMFGAGAAVDVFGLLATTANLANDSVFGNGVVTDPFGLPISIPIGFTAAASPGQIAVQNGASIISRGGPLMFIGGGNQSSTPGVLIAGSVRGDAKGNTPAQIASSQVLYGAAGDFTLLFGRPNALTSPDIALFSFQIDSGLPRTIDTINGGQAVDVISLTSTSQTSAGSLAIAAAAPPAADPTDPSLDTFRIRVSAPITAVNTIAITGGGGVFGDQSGLLPSRFLNADPPEVDVLFRREVFSSFLPPPQPPPIFGSEVVLTAGAGTFIAGRDVVADQTTQVFGPFGAKDMPDHNSVRFVQSGTGRSQLTIEADRDIQLRNALFVPNTTAAPSIEAARNLTIENSLGDITLGPAPLANNFSGGGVTAGGALIVREIATPMGQLPATPINISGHYLGARLFGPTSILVSTRGSVNVTGIEGAGNITVSGDTRVGGAFIATTGGNISVTSVDGPVSMGAIFSYPSLSGPVSYAATGAVTVKARGDVSTSGDVFANVVELTSSEGTVDLGDNRSKAPLSGNVTAANGITISAAQEVFTDALTATNSAVTINAGTAITTGDITARNTSPITSTSGAITTGNITVSNAGVTINGPTSVTTGNVTALQQVSVTGNNGPVTTGALTGSQVNVTSVNNSLTITGAVASQSTATITAAQGAVTTAAINAVGALNVTARNVVTTGGLSTTAASIDVTSNAGPVTTGAIVAQEAVQVTSGGGLTVAGTIVSTANRVAVQTNGPVTTGAIDAGTSVSVTATSGAFGTNGRTVIARNGAAAVNAAGGVSTAAVSATGAVDLASAAGGINAGALLAGTTVTVAGLTGVGVGVVFGDGAVSLTSGAGPVSTGLINSRTSGVTLAGQGNVTAGDISAQSNVNAASTAGALTTGVVATPGGGFVGTAAGAITTGVVTVRDAVDVDAGANATTGSVTSTANAIRVDGTSVTTGVLDAGTGVTVTGAAGPIMVNSARARGGAAAITSGGSVNVGDVLASGAVTVSSSSNSVQAGSVVGGGAVSLSGQSGTRATSVQGASVAIASGAGFTGIGTTGQQPAPGAVLATSGDAIVSGQTGVEAGAISANAARVAVTSANGPVTTGALTAALSVTASAAGEVRTGIVTAGTFADIASTTGAVVTGAVTAKTERARVVGAGSVTTGVVTAGREVEVTSSGGALQTGNLTGAATVAANGAQGVTVGVVDAGTGAALGSLSGAVTSGNITARAGAATITAARGVNAGAVTATTAINATGGDDVVLGSLTAPTIVVAATGGDVTVQGATGQRFSASARAGTAGPGDITVAGAVNLSGGATPTNPALRIQASNAVTIQAPVTSVFDGFVQAGGTLTTAAPVRITGAVGVTTLGGQPALPTFGGLDLRAGDVVIGDVVIVRGGAGLTVSALGGGATVGDGLTGPTQGLLALSNAELQRLDAATVSLRVGLSDPTSGGQSAVLTGSSIQVGDLTVDRARIGQLALVTGSTGAVRVRGVVSGIGAPSVSFGDSQSRPGAIEITGSVGTLDRPIGSTSFLSSGDVLFGTQAFVDRVNQASDPTIMDIAGLARDFGGATSGQVFLVTNAADFNTPGVILSQNTGATGAFAGLRFGTPTAAGGSVFTATGAPQRIEVFGVVVRADGTLATGADAALAPNLLASGPAIDTDFKINDCVIGQAGGCTTAKTFDPVVLTSVKMLQPGPGSRGNPGSSASRPNGGPPGGTARRTKEAASRFEVDPSIQDLQSTGDDSDQRDPGVGAANEDLWPTE